MATTTPPNMVGIWLGATALIGTPQPADQPYPCLCGKIGEEWQRTRGCTWKHKVTGQTLSKCPCWGRPVAAWMPADCCARHFDSPARLLSVDGETPDPEAAPAESPVEPFAPGTTEEGVSSLTGGSERAGTTFKFDAEAALKDWEGEAWPEEVAHARRWTAEEITCPCPTPWDRDKKPGGYHCTGCCRYFQSFALASVHQRSWTASCRDPETIVDHDTGAPLLAARLVAGMLVWGSA